MQKKNQQPRIKSYFYHEFATIPFYCTIISEYKEFSIFALVDLKQGAFNPADRTTTDQIEVLLGSHRGCTMNEC